MKLIETLNSQDKVNLLNGNPVGFFPYMILSTDSFYNKLFDLCLGYYTARSGEKTISPAYEKFIAIVGDNPQIGKSPEELLGTLIRGKFIDKWDRVYDTLINSQYNALYNREYTEDKTGNNQNKDTHNTIKEKQGNNSDTTIYNTNTEDDGNTGTSETTTRNINDDNTVYGFNSPIGVGDNSSVESTSETIVGEADKNTSHNLRKKTGTETKNFGIDESETHTGTDITDITIKENTIKNGREGSGAELIMEELNLRNTQLFFDIIYNDIDSVVALQIYI